MHIEKITWVDSFGCSSGWKTLTNLEKEIELHIVSIGYVASETDQYILVVPHFHGEFKVDWCKGEASGCGDMAIPKVSIIERIVLEKDDG
jgi:hypothetical protein